MNCTGETHLRDNGGNTNTKVDVETVLDFLSSTCGDLMSPVERIRSVGVVCVFGASRNALCLLILLVLSKSENLDFLSLSSLNNPVDENTGNVDGVGRKTSNGAVFRNCLGAC